MVIFLLRVEILLGSGLWIESTQLLGVDHRKHFRESLSYSCNSLGRISEGQLAPGHKLDFLAIQIDQIFLAGSARVAAEVFFVEHSVFVCWVLTLAHKQIVQVF